MSFPEPSWFYDKFRGLPRLHTTSCMYPPVDGDTSLIDELIDRIIDAHPRRLATVPQDFIYEITKSVTGIDPDASWPFDRAGEMVWRWKRES